MTRPVLYVCAPFRTRTPEEAERTDAAMRRALELGWAPIFAPMLYQPLGLRDDIPGERDAALAAAVGLLSVSHSVLVVGLRITEGMGLELDAWGARSSRAPFKWPDLPPAHSSMPMRAQGST